MMIVHYVVIVVFLITAEIKRSSIQADLLGQSFASSEGYVEAHFAMAVSTKNPDKVKHVDALRLRKYISCYILQHRRDDFS